MQISKSGQSYYQILGVNQDATVLNIEAAWEKKKDDYNPQQLQGLEGNARRLVKAETERIKEAYKVLKDPEKRQEYNRWLAGHGTSPTKQTQFTQSKRFMSKQAEIANDRAIQCWEQNRFDEAIAQWEAAINSNPNIAEIHHNLGNAYAHQNHTEEAIESLKRALSIDPNLVEAYNKLGCIFYRQGNRDFAFASWKQALKIKPDFKEALHNLRLLQNATQFDVNNEIPVYERDDLAEGDEKASWKNRVRQGVGKLIGKTTKTDSE